MVIRTGSQIAFVWIVIQGSAARSCRTWTGRIDCLKASRKPTRSCVPLDPCLPPAAAFERLRARSSRRTAVRSPSASSARGSVARVGSVTAARLGAFGPLGAGHGHSCGLGRMVERHRSRYLGGRGISRGEGRLLQPCHLAARSPFPPGGHRWIVPGARGSTALIVVAARRARRAALRDPRSGRGRRLAAVDARRLRGPDRRRLGLRRIRRDRQPGRRPRSTWPASRSSMPRPPGRRSRARRPGRRRRSSGRASGSSRERRAAFTAMADADLHRWVRGDGWRASRCASSVGRSSMRSAGATRRTRSSRGRPRRRRPPGRASSGCRGPGWERDDTNDNAADWFVQASAVAAGAGGAAGAGSRADADADARRPTPDDRTPTATPTRDADPRPTPTPTATPVPTADADPEPDADADPDADAHARRRPPTRRRRPTPTPDPSTRSPTRADSADGAEVTIRGRPDDRSRRPRVRPGGVRPGRDGRHRALPRRPGDGSVAGRDDGPRDRGDLDSRYAQRTLRVAESAIVDASAPVGPPGRAVDVEPAPRGSRSKGRRLAVERHARAARTSSRDGARRHRSTTAPVRSALVIAPDGARRPRPSTTGIRRGVDRPARPARQLRDRHGRVSHLRDPRRRPRRGPAADPDPDGHADPGHGRTRDRATPTADDHAAATPSADADRLDRAEPAPTARRHDASPRPAPPGRRRPSSRSAAR